MGRTRKPFIDKRNATTFSLTFNEVPSDEEGDPSELDHVEEENEYEEYFHGPRSDLGGYVLSEERREENLKFGFPDDGYDYLAHLRSLRPLAGAGTSSSAAEPAVQVKDVPEAGPVKGRAQDADNDEGGVEADAPTGPSVFIPATVVQKASEDMKLVDARMLVVQRKVEEEEEAMKESATVSAFAKEQKETLGKGKLLCELREMEKSMLKLEEEDIEEDAGEDYDGGDWSEWMDEFVVSAAKPELKPALIDSNSAAAELAGEGEEGGGESDNEYEEEEEEEERSGRPQGPLPAGISPSIASSYWRKERADRKGELTTLDTCFEGVAAQYDEDALGELDDEAAEKARGNADISNFTHILDDFLREQRALEGREGTTEGGASVKGGLAHGPHEPGFGEGSDEDDDYYDEDDESGCKGSGHRLTRGSRAATNGYQGPHNKVAALQDVDAEVIAKTKARLAQEEAKMAAGAGVDSSASTSAAGPLPQGREGAELKPVGLDWYESKGSVMLEEDAKWDCESILSLRSNMENHPAKIVEPQRRAGNKDGGAIKLSAKSGMPAIPKPHMTTVEEQGGSEESEDEHFDGDDDEGGGGAGEQAAIYIRRKGESAEEKKARKAAVKAEKRDARTTKKMVKSLFKEEGARQKKQAAGNKGQAAPGLSTFVIP